jgi:AmmeMemoRadiSam system protein B/AmmeMemoRadiSam system protein A
MPSIRPAAVAGAFYPADAQALREAVDRHLTHARAASQRRRTTGQPPKILVVPHAGYVYSGDVAARAYAELAPWRDRIRRVVVLGPSHRVPLRGIAAPSATAFDTPLGRLPVDTEAMGQLDRLRPIVWSDEPHRLEHSVEVQLPFLQRVLGPQIHIVPLVVGEAGAQEVAQVLEQLWGADETLIVVSTDLSHYLPYNDARASDRSTVERILHLDTDLEGDDACGAAPLNGALLAAFRHGLAPRLLDLRNSADTAGGDRHRVVGYAALVFEPPAAAGERDSTADGDALGSALVAIARDTLRQALGLPPPEGSEPPPAHPALAQPGATFVTLHDAQGRLRGCVGRLEATRALVDDVRANALAAAFHDSRFSPLRPEEWPSLRVEVSLLQPPEPVPARTETDALQAIRPGIDGLIFDWRGARATLLPQVWKDLPVPRDFMVALKRKAGLPADFWAPDVRLYRYQARAYGPD